MNKMETGKNLQEYSQNFQPSNGEKIPINEKDIKYLNKVLTGNLRWKYDAKLANMIRTHFPQDFSDVLECSTLNIPGYKALKPIGRGSCKKVYMGINEILYNTEISNQRHYVALKVFMPTQKGWDILLLKGQTLEEVLRNELRVGMNSVFNQNNININGILHAFIDPDGRLITIEPYCNRGTLMEHDEELRHGKIDYNKAFNYMRQIVSGCYGLNKMGILHDNLKFENILVNVVDDIEVIRLTDFGQSPNISSLSEDKPYSNLGYPLYMAPELLCSKNPPSEDSENHTKGCLFYRMLFGKDIVDIKMPNIWYKIRVNDRLEKYDKSIKNWWSQIGYDGVMERIVKNTEDLYQGPIKEQIINYFALFFNEEGKRKDPFQQFIHWNQGSPINNS